MLRELTEEECRYAAEKGEFEQELVRGPAAAVILTQSWCPQWKAMRGYLPEAEEKAAALAGGARIYFVEYDIAEWRSLSPDDFMSFKEKTWKNPEIPYVRYYRNGVFYRDSNFISLQGFIERLAAGAA